MALAIFAGGCKTGVAVAIDVSPDGSGRVGIRLSVDSEADGRIRALTGRGFSESFLLSDVIDAGWDVRRLPDEPSPTIEVSRRFASPGELSAVFRTVEDGTPTIFREVQLEQSRTVFRTTFAFSARLDLTGGPLSEPLTESVPASARDAVQQAASGWEFDATRDASLTLSLKLPGSVTSADSDETGPDSELIWRMPGGSARSLSAMSVLPDMLNTWLAAASALGLAGLVSLGVTVVVRRSRRRRAARRGGHLGGGSTGVGEPARGEIETEIGREDFT